MSTKHSTGDFLNYFILSLMVICVLLPQQSIASDCKLVERLSVKQKTTIMESYAAGEAEGFGFSLAAIAWQESNAGEVLVNAFDPSFGIYHINLKTAASREGKSRSGSYEKNLIAQRLLDDPEYATYHAIEELRYWRKKYPQDWLKVWAGYNAGHRIVNGAPYAKKIQGNIRLLQKCLITQDFLLANS